MSAPARAGRGSPTRTGVADGRPDGPIRAAGAVVWRPGGVEPEVALVHRPRYDDWSYPKGKCEPGEHVLATAVREVAEETGLRIALGRPLTPSVYQVRAGVKQVAYWVARCTGFAGFVPNDEVDEVRWLPADDARKRLSYDRDKALLEEFGSGPVSTVPLILLRHAAAGRKLERVADGAAAADLARPLDANGSAEAESLAGLLASYGRCRVISSAAERCLATVRPYAAAFGVSVETEPAFTVGLAPASQAELLGAGTVRPVPVGEQSGTGPPAGLTAGSGAGLPAGPGAGPAARRVAARAAAGRVAALAAAGEPTLICAHRENLPELIDAAFGALGVSPPGAEPLGKSEFWVLQSAGGVLVSAERHDPRR